MYNKLKNDILGKKYSLSLAFVSAKKSKELNKKYRGKNKVANVLAFPYSKKEGEILLCRSEIRKDTRKFGKKYPDLLVFMLIHGMLHLKGLRHGQKMENLEKKFEKKYLSRIKF